MEPTRPLSTAPADYTCDAVQSLMVWIRERPSMYCCTAGELDTLLHYFHLIWSKASGKDRQYEEATERIRGSMRLSGAAGLLDDRDRVEFLSQEGPAAKKVLQYWTAVDEFLGLVAPLERL